VLCTVLLCNTSDTVDSLARHAAQPEVRNRAVSPCSLALAPEPTA